MQFKFKFASLFTLMMVFFLATAQNVMAQKSPEPVASVKAAQKISLEDLINKGTATVDEKSNKITINVDGKKLAPKALVHLKSQKHLQVEQSFELKKSITDAAFKNAKIASSPVVIPQGSYEISNSVERIVIIICGKRWCLIIIINNI